MIFINFLIFFSFFFPFILLSLFSHFFFLIWRRFLHEMVKASRLFCLFVFFFNLNCRLIVHNFITFLPFPKDLQSFSLSPLFQHSFTFYFKSYIVLLRLVLLLIYFKRFYDSYQWAEFFCSAMLVFSWWSLLAVVLNFAENRPRGALKRSALCNGSVLCLFLCTILT